MADKIPAPPNPHAVIRDTLRDSALIATGAWASRIIEDLSRAGFAIERNGLRDRNGGESR